MTEISRLLKQSEVSSAIDDRQWIVRALREHEPGLIRYAWFYVRDKDTAQEIVQEAFLKLCQQKQSDVGAHLKQWLFRVCRNRAVDICRKEKRMLNLADENPIEAVDRAPGPSDSIVHQETSQSLFAQIGRLPHKQQEVLRLKFQSGFSYKEIAAVTGLTQTNVGVLLHTAISKLRQQMA